MNLLIVLFPLLFTEVNSRSRFKIGGGGGGGQLGYKMMIIGIIIGVIVAVFFAFAIFYSVYYYCCRKNLKIGEQTEAFSFSELRKNEHSRKV